MKFSLVVAFVVLAATSAQAQQREPAPPPQDPSVATIRGEVIGGFFGTSGTRIAAIDGKTIHGPEESCARLDLEPGPHSIVIANDHVLVPLRLDAVAGAAYIVSEPKDDVLLIEDSTSGETVFRSIEEEEGELPLYAVPFTNSSNTATISVAQAHLTSWLTGADVQQGDSYLHTVDGKPLPAESTTATVEAGKRAISLHLFAVEWPDAFSANPAVFAPGGRFGWWQVLPLLLDVEAGHEYLIELGRVRVGNFDAHTTARILDKTSGKEITPTLSVPLNAINRGVTYYAGLSYDTQVSFPEKNGQLKRSPPREKQWCERDD